MNYEPLTAVNRIKKTEVPPVVDVGGQQIILPRRLLQSSPHMMVDSQGKGVEATYITMPLAHLLNAYRLTDMWVRKNELVRAVKETNELISELIKQDVLRKKHKGGAMSFSQSHENVPEDSLMISERTFKALCDRDSRWAKTSHVYCIRFPNLGPQTTIKLRLLVNSRPIQPLESGLSTEAQSTLLTLKSLLEEQESTNVIEAFYLNPKVLKGCLEGDGDGDLVYCVRAGWGKPWFKEVAMVRSAAAIDNTEVEKLLKKAGRMGGEPISKYLPTYFDDTPIGQATYAIRWRLYQTIRQMKDSRPMHQGWKEISPWALELIEFVMDIRKGESSENEIQAKIQEIKRYSKDLAMASSSGDWFAKTVTTTKIEDVDGFIRQFPTLNAFCDMITAQKEELV